MKGILMGDEEDMKDPGPIEEVGEKFTGATPSFLSEMWVKFATAALAGRCSYSTATEERETSTGERYGGVVQFNDEEAVESAVICADLMVEEWKKRFIRAK